ncbi:hypothetical protein Ciccas_011799 [Cichlidogyrus casuarinus]|uniref:Uncharacterized protein n=1 Tax=Cichlidogyrus casuarinus TaxID=1844966 RepID=A0ABD2PRX7_9PLAT
MNGDRTGFINRLKSKSIEWLAAQMRSPAMLCSNPFEPPRSMQTPSRRRKQIKKARSLSAIPANCVSLRRHSQNSLFSCTQKVIQNTEIDEHQDLLPVALENSKKAASSSALEPQAHLPATSG